MKIEVLFPEVCNLYGDLGNVRYLKSSLENAVRLSDGAPIYDVEIIETHLTDKPLFLREKPDLIYMGTMTEIGQKLVIKKLSQYKDQLRKCIEDGVNFLVTGNAVEVFGNAIIEDGEEVIRGLGLVDIETRRSSLDRYNCLYVGDFDAGDEQPLKVVGYKSLFGFIYGNDVENNELETVVGYGSNLDTKKEGIRINNFVATQLIGPLLPLNPLLTKWYMNVVFEVGFEPACNEAALEAYQARLDEYMTPGKGWKY